MCSVSAPWFHRPVSASVSARSSTARCASAFCSAIETCAGEQLDQLELLVGEADARRPAARRSARPAPDRALRNGATISAPPAGRIIEVGDARIGQLVLHQLRPRRCG